MYAIFQKSALFADYQPGQGGDFLGMCLVVLIILFIYGIITRA
jgi:hypothetical protein